MKAFLVKHNLEFGRTDSLEFLIALCPSIDKDFEKLYDVVSGLDYVVDVRYPDEFYIPSVEEARSVFESATRVKRFVLAKMGIDPTSFEEKN